MGMRPINFALMVVLTLGLLFLLGWTQQSKRRSVKIRGWIGAILLLFIVRWFAPLDIGPATWADVADDIMPDGYAGHSVETAVSVDEHWIVGETKACKSYPYIPQIATFLKKGLGYAADSLNCDDGPMHMVKATLYGRLNQPEHRIVYWNCTRNPENFTCRQTGAE